VSREELTAVDIDSVLYPVPDERALSERKSMRTINVRNFEITVRARTARC